MNKYRVTIKYKEHSKDEEQVDVISVESETLVQATDKVRKMYYNYWIISTNTELVKDNPKGK